jgi:hypothetical protein
MTRVIIVRERPRDLARALADGLGAAHGGERDGGERGDGHGERDAARHKEEAGERHARHLVADVQVSELLAVDHPVEEVDAPAHVHDALAVDDQNVQPGED